MRNAVFLALAAFLAMGAHGAVPTSAEGWYTPNGGKFKTTSSTGYVYYFDRDGYWVQNATITVNEDGEITGYDGNIDELGPAYPAYLAMVEALHAETLAKRNKERIETIGRNLHDLTSATGINITNPETGKSYTIRFGGGTIENAVNTTGGGNIPATSDEDDPADGVSLTWTGAGNTLEIAGWNVGSSDVMTPLAEAMTGGSGSVFDDYAVLVRNKNKGVNYVKVGSLVAGGAPVDDVSLTTNTIYGAVKGGEVSLYGFSTKAQGKDETRLPYVNKGETWLDWAGLSQFVDGESLAYDTENDCLKIADYSDSLGPNKYLGTADDAHGGAWGVHDLPNVTTNSIDVDDVTIKAEIHDATGTKIISLRSVPPSAGPPFAATGDGNGGIAYVPMPESVTNGVGCTCSNRWHNVKTWTGKSFDPDEDGLEGSEYDFKVPYDWLASPLTKIFESGADNGKLTLEGWYEGTANCSFTLAQMLDADNQSAQQHADGHLVFTRYVDGAGNVTPHYVQIGNLGVTPKVDGRSIVSNSVGELALAGFDGAAGQEGLMPVTVISGMETTLAWVPTNGPASSSSCEVDNASITTNSATGATADGVASLYGWSDAGDGTVPVKSGGVISWVTNTPPYDVAWRYDAAARVWRNAHVMVGSRVLDVTSNSLITDGAWYVEVDIENRTASLVKTGYSNTDTVKYVYVGTITNGVQSDGIYTMPIIFIWE